MALARVPLMVGGARAGYWITAAAQFAICAFALVPTPMWPRYAATAHLDALAINTLFGVYAVCVVSALLLSPRLFTRLRRVTIMRAALLLEIIAALFFILTPTFPGLLIARVASGVGVGFISASATANLFDLGEIRRAAGVPVQPARTATASTLGGFAVGAAGSGVSVHVLPQFPAIPMVLCLVAMTSLVIATFAVPLDPAPRAEPRGAQPVPTATPPGNRRIFTGALICAFATNSLFGLVSVSAAVLISHNTTAATGLAAGLTVAGMQSCGGLAQAAIPADWDSVNRVAPFTAFASGAALLAASTTIQSTPLLACGAALAGLGGGMFVRRALESASASTGPQRRGNAAPTVYLVFYLGMSAPVVGAGWLADTIGLGAATRLFLGVAMMVAAVGEMLVVVGRWAGRPAARQMGRQAGGPAPAVVLAAVAGAANVVCPGIEQRLDRRCPPLCVGIEHRRCFPQRMHVRRNRTPVVPGGQNPQRIREVGAQHMSVRANE
ncbi:major facilitator superfamily protein MFS_1 [Mycolicibacterium smegmatis MKD8]|uniref:Major facilitator superfamily protein MFS_1 n=1 Tax=Mycolicibacterium smegmatis (strain MKD8) TaxID=1214915 RepID=A0A2U9PIA4_MYCSE|nr:MFS transporter [Mycolicibacterium smegmatis]AWT51460.1 major facilitator superfamily protein MFS_1 [Mycolicibacterium smegmatis MKD8]